MRLFILYLRSRLTQYCLPVLSLLATGTWLWIERVDPEWTVLPLLLAPLAVAVTIGVSTLSPFDELERAVSRLPRLRLAHLTGLIAWGTLGLLLATATLAQDDTPPVVIRDLASLTGPAQDNTPLVVIRNLAGLTGLALLGAVLLGSQLSWIIPTAYATLIIWSGAATHWVLWVWRPPDDREAMLIALALLAAGLVAVTCFGAREARAGNSALARGLGTALAWAQVRTGMRP